MAEYRAYILDRQGRIEKAIPMECATDEIAMDRAKQLAEGKSVELWQRELMVAILKHLDGLAETS